MGIVIRQSLKGTIVVYVGTVLAVLLNIIIFPYCFTLDQVGLLRVLPDIAVLISYFASLGMQSSIFKFFPYFNKGDKYNNGFLLLITLIPLLGFILFAVAFYLFRDVFVSVYQKDSPLLAHYSYMLLPITFSIMFATIYETYSSANYRIVFPKIIRELVLRLGIMAFCFLYLYQYVDFDAFLNSYSFFYLLCVPLLMVYLRAIGKLNFGRKIHFEEPGLGRQIVTFNSYLIFGGIGGLLVNKIDILMIGASPNGDMNNGIYTTALLMASMIELPGRTIGQISAPIIAEHMKTGHFAEVQKMYRNSSIAQLTIGSLLFTLLWCNIDNIFAIMPQGQSFAAGKWCVFFIGISQLFNMVTSLNGAILGLSKHYKFGFYATIFLGLVSVASNWFFIPRYGIQGAAYATAINIFLYQFSILFYLWLKTKMHPFSGKTILPVIIMLLAFGLSYIVPRLDNPWVDGAIRSTFIAVLFVVLSLFLNVSPYFNTIFKQALQKTGLKK